MVVLDSTKLRASLSELRQRVIQQDRWTVVTIMHVLGLTGAAAHAPMYQPSKVLSCVSGALTLQTPDTGETKPAKWLPKSAAVVKESEL